MTQLELYVAISASFNAIGLALFLIVLAAGDFPLKRSPQTRADIVIRVVLSAGLLLWASKILGWL